MSQASSFDMKAVAVILLGLSFVVIPVCIAAIHRLLSENRFLASRAKRDS